MEIIHRAYLDLFTTDSHRTNTDRYQIWGGGLGTGGGVGGRGASFPTRRTRYQASTKYLCKYQASTKYFLHVPDTKQVPSTFANTKQVPSTFASTKQVQSTFASRTGFLRLS